MVAERNAHRLALERSPNYGTVANRELGQSAAWENAAFRDIKGVHDGDDIVASSAGSLNIPQKLASNQLVHILAEVRGM